MQSTLKTKDKIVLFPFWLITLLPLPILYLFSDFIYILLYYIGGYRKTVTRKNLANAFPDMGINKRLKLERRFYRYLCDYFIESIYLINMSQKECNRRYRYVNPEVALNYYNAGRNVILAISHYGNWEWATNSHQHIGFHCYGIYKPLKNKVFDRLFIFIRARYGNSPVPMKKTLRTVITAIKEKIRFSLFLVGDQRPTREDTHLWVNFLNQDTPVITGNDRMARQFDLAVLFMKVIRVKRGYYDVVFEVISDSPKTEPEYEIARKYMNAVERQVYDEPAYWLWSHKRWKYDPKIFKPKA